MKPVWAWLGRVTYWVGGVVIMPLKVNNTRRVKVAILNNDSTHLLLAKNFISEQAWSIVGGGVHDGESDEMAAVREVAEETGITLQADTLQFIDQRVMKSHLARYTAVFYVAFAPDMQLRRQKLEILDLQWFPVDALPAGRKTEVIDDVILPAINRGE